MNIIDKFHNWRRKLRWNKQYKSGRWDNLKSHTEAVRYKQIISFIKTYGKANPSIMDLGAGEGVLNEKIIDLEYSYFLGMDFSSVSIKKANKKKFQNSEFIVADLHTFKPIKQFDIIVFNEAFYYIHNTEKENVLKTMINSLNPDGILITSIYREGTGCWEYFERDTLKQLDFVTVKTNDEKTYWKIGVYKKL
ncbi:class I SAM-dependent methyltransferase [Ichthyenterobacterium magnum]|uniref:Methyltransferase family protein n=1 Tax=Ichthyenterobacterium magnum TaxID=1230530 RepID=A0A420DGZ5_9FLAO|nr:methyltransferase domain-containing protein [Ichthyenterobacterium magnum]RKE92357.1 methyltransferase family protein [Ichthyenterobacterium magnum]